MVLSHLTMSMFNVTSLSNDNDFVESYVGEKRQSLHG